ncbi:MAG: tRNA (guanosine(46)-N7)-methyltransferase TrmB [Gammaproteobacteria bacterium]|nr:tRNA (guanosine(46)-N7)-methyltransferase TrmB [Gammaproteobacteria bacterium]
MSYGNKQIVSFVRRSARMSTAQKRALENLWHKYAIDLNDSLLDFTKLFDNQNPVILEIGFGMGDNLLSLAESHAEQNFIGVDVHKPGVASVLRCIEEQQLSNIRLYGDDVVEFLQRAVVDASLDAVLIFFPDPWPKRRHRKRRLMNEKFISILARVLKPKGSLYFATDWQYYAEEVLHIMESNEQFGNQAGKNQFANRPEFRPVTKFERRGERLGHKVFDLHFIRS